MWLHLKSFVKKKNFKQYLLFLSVIVVFLLLLMEIFHSFDNKIYTISNKRDSKILFLSTKDDIAHLKEKLNSIKSIVEINLINDNSYKDYEIVVDNFSNIQNTIDVINSKDYLAYIYNIDKYKEITVYNNIKNILLVIIVLHFFIIYWLTHNVIKNILYEEKNDIALLKSMGYKNATILKINLFKTFLLALLSLVLSGLLIIIINYFMITVLDIKYFDILNQFFIVIIGYSIIILIANITFINKIKKISPMALFN